MSRAYLNDFYQRNPTYATYLGILTDTTIALRITRARVSPRRSDRPGSSWARGGDSPDHADAHQSARPRAVARAIDSRLLTLETIQPWARDPDSYSGGLTRTAYIMIKREFAPPEERLRQLIAREMPAALAEARKAIESAAHLHRDCHRADGWQPGILRNRGRVGISDAPTRLLAEFKAANDAVVAATEHKKWLQDDLLKRSNGNFAMEKIPFAENWPPTR